MPAQWPRRWDNSSRDTQPCSTGGFQRLPSGLDNGTDTGTARWTSEKFKPARWPRYWDKVRFRLRRRKRHCSPSGIVLKAGLRAPWPPPDGQVVYPDGRGPVRGQAAKLSHGRVWAAAAFISEMTLTASTSGPNRSECSPRSQKRYWSVRWCCADSGKPPGFPRPARSSRVGGWPFPCANS